MWSVAHLHCDGGNPRYVGTYWFGGCGYKMSVPAEDRYNYEFCPVCRGKLITWSVEDD